MKCWRLFNRLAVVISNRADVHWLEPGVTSYIQTYAAETQLINITYRASGGTGKSEDQRCTTI